MTFVMREPDISQSRRPADPVAWMLYVNVHIDDRDFGTRVGINA